MIKQNNMVLMKALEVLQDICDIYSYYVPVSLSALHEREKMVDRMNKLEDKLKDYSEESGREIFFLRQSLNDLRSSAKLLTVVTRDLFAKITQQVSEAQKDINNKHQSAITELWRLNNSAAELNQQNKQKLKTYEEEIKKAETTKEDIKHIKHLVANLSLSRLKLRNMVTEYTDELSSTTQVELAKLYRYLDAYNHSLCKTVFTPPEPNRVRIADVKRELQMQDVILLEEE